MLVACPVALVARTENLPLCAALTASMLRTAWPSLNEIRTPGKAAAERTWPSRNHDTSGTGAPGGQMESGLRWRSVTWKGAFHSPLAECLRPRCFF